RGGAGGRESRPIRSESVAREKARRAKGPQRVFHQVRRANAREAPSGKVRNAAERIEERPVRQIEGEGVDGEIAAGGGPSRRPPPPLGRGRWGGGRPGGSREARDDPPRESPRGPRPAGREPPRGPARLRGRPRRLLEPAGPSARP